MSPVLVNLLDGCVDQVDLGIFPGKPDDFFAESRFVKVIISGQDDKVSFGECDGVISLSHLQVAFPLYR